jgi:two-component system LytT family response regulator
MAEPIRALVVDDEALARANLRQALTAHSGWLVAGECPGARAARAFLASSPVDVVFLDVQMPFESGISLARGLVDAPLPPLIVFVTAFDQYAIEAFEVQALDYLLKPVDDARLALALARVEEAITIRQRAAYALAVVDAADEIERGHDSGANDSLQRICVRSVGAMESVAVAAVEWISSAGNYVELHLAGRTILHRITMSTLERRLDPAEFIRVHRTAIVRRGLVTSIESAGDGSFVLSLSSGERVPVSERYAPSVRALISC